MGEVQDCCLSYKRNSDTEAKIKVGTLGSLTSEITMSKAGVCFSPPTFNLYISNIVPRVYHPEFIAPTLGHLKISILWFTDDMVFDFSNQDGIKKASVQSALSL